MKSIVTILAIIFVSNCYSQNESFWFPEDLPIDPIDYSLKILGVKEVEIFNVVLKDDTTQAENGNYNIIDMKYVIKYDSINQLVSINYNFREHLDYEILADNKTLSITPNTDNKFLHSLIYSNDTILFSSWVNLYYYEGSYLKDIKIERPQRIEDGVYISKRIIENIKFESITEGELLKQKKIYHEEKLFSTIEYEYTTIKRNDKQFQLLTKIKTKYEGDYQTTEQIIKYSL
jgi:hypothetical protein